MTTRVAILGIIVENRDAVEPLNILLHEYSSYVIGRMGIPYQKRECSIISIAMDAPIDVINTLTGKIGQIRGVTAKAAFSNVIGEN